ncbi:MAG: helicase-associated domain-containing protein [Planctomycetota bacterium]
MTPAQDPQLPAPDPDGPLVVQPDGTMLLHTVRTLLDAEGQVLRSADGQPQTEPHPQFERARAALAGFAELKKSPEYLHTYKLTPVSIWNAIALGWNAQEIIEQLAGLVCVPLPAKVLDQVRLWATRYGLLELRREGNRFELCSENAEVLAEMLERPAVRELVEIDDQGRAWVTDVTRGPVKQALIRLGYPVRDLGGYVDGDPLALHFRETTRGGRTFSLRDYQDQAATAFHADGGVTGGNGVVVLPCGAGKTVTAMAAMTRVGAKTLILTTNTVAVRQWRDELLDKTTLTEDEVGEYTGDVKRVAPVTISTYQMLTFRKAKGEAYHNLELFREHNWGLVVYDEVHLLPAPVFRMTAELQARRRLGLTATLVREDGKEEDVFCLIGPKRYEMPWKDLESAGFIATARLVEVRLPLDAEQESIYRACGPRDQSRIAAENPRKLERVAELVREHGATRILVIGQYLQQLEALRRHLGAPLITGKTPTPRREELYAAFREGREGVLIVSKVGNFAIDLPDANVAIQVSGTFGSRQEEAQRLGRILRPKSDGAPATFYTLVTSGSRELDFARRRQLFLAEQGYSYQIIEEAGGNDTAGKRGA